MRRVLAADEATGELRLVLTSLWDGQHERTEFRVIGADRRPLRASRLPEVIGLPVRHEHGPAGSVYYLLTGPLRARRNVDIEPVAVGPTGRTPCPKAANRRRKCALCAAETREDEH